MMIRILKYNSKNNNYNCKNKFKCKDFQIKKKTGKMNIE